MVKRPELKNARDYATYKELVAQCANTKTTTGSEHLPERIEATILNAQRMKRIDKQLAVDERIKKEVEKLKNKWSWIVLAESWCGDGAQNIPVIAKIASLFPNIDLKIILRDEHPELMDQYLTNGSKSIPKLICFDRETDEEIGTWGPRPTSIQQMVLEYKKQNPGVSHDEFVKNLHTWYAKDNGKSMQEDLLKLIPKWIASEGN